MSDARSFIDANILLYSIDFSYPDRQTIASNLLRDLASTGTGVISIQIAHEFASNLIRKFGRTPEEASLLCEGLSDLAFAESNLDTLRDALRIMSVASLSFWDACVVAAAKQAGCAQLYSEDLNPGQVVSGIRILNPFLKSGHN